MTAAVALKITELRTIQTMRAEGASTREIAIATGRSTGVIYRACRWRGLIAPTRTKLTETQRAEIVAAYLAGEPARTLARQYRINASYVSRLARRVHDG